MTTALPVKRADGLITLGLHLDAWEFLESLPPADRLAPPGLALRRVICREFAHVSHQNQGRQAVPKPGPGGINLAYSSRQQITW